MNANTLVYAGILVGIIVGYFLRPWVILILTTVVVVSMATMLHRLPEGAERTFFFLIWGTILFYSFGAMFVTTLIANKKTIFVHLAPLKKLLR